MLAFFRRMTKRDFHYRFAVGNPNGPRSGIWRVWTSKSPKSDVYIAARNLGGILKVSLHESGEWRAAFTFEFASEKFDESIPVSQSRLIEEWVRPSDISPGVTLAFRIVIPNHDLMSIPVDASSVTKINWITPPIEDDLTEVAIFLTHPNVVTTDWPGKNKMGTKLLASYDLANGEKLWLVYLYGTTSSEWHDDRKRFQVQLARTKPKISNLIGNIRSKGHRIMVGGYYPDGSRYYLDLSARKVLTIPIILRLYFWSVLYSLRNLVADFMKRVSA